MLRRAIQLNGKIARRVSILPLELTTRHLIQVQYGLEDDRRRRLSLRLAGTWNMEQAEGILQVLYQ